MDRRITAKISTVRHGFEAIVLVVSTALLLAACGSSAGANAKNACNDVESAISLYKSSLSQSNSITASSELIKSLNLLRSALPKAAIAAGSNGVYQALQATLSETNRVPEKLLVTALSRQCATILPSNSKLAVPGGYVPPSNIKANPGK